MLSNAVRITTGSRLHFGMFSFGDPSVRQFGGVGCMIDKPGVQLRVCSAKSIEAHGPLADRAAEFAKRIAGLLPNWPHAWRIDVERAPRDHIGLGVGTQLALAVEAGMTAKLGTPDAAALAQATGRAERSSIGVHGFLQGGFLVEAGKLQPIEIGPLIARVELPTEWRFLVFAPRQAAGLSGKAERDAFSSLPPVPRHQTAEMTRLALMELLPAAVEADFAAFSRSLYRFNCLTGKCFAAAQQGLFFDQRTTTTVAALRSLGIEGVAQSSWGPSVAALLPSEAAGVQLTDTLRTCPFAADYELILAAPLNRGALVKGCR